MRITAAMVKELRERTGAGMMDCKRALTEAEGDMEKAVGIMRLSGQAKADKKAGRITAEGVVAIKVDDAGIRAAMVEINCETDFVAKEDAFRGFVDAVCDRVLAADPADLDELAGMSLDGGGGPSVEEERRGLVAKTGENISLRRFAAIDAKGGRLGAYLHGTRIGVVVDVEGADDVVARDVAMHVAASRPVARLGIRHARGDARPGAGDPRSAGRRQRKAGRDTGEDAGGANGEVPEGGYPARPAVREGPRPVGQAGISMRRERPCSASSASRWARESKGRRRILPKK